MGRRHLRHARRVSPGPRASVGFRVQLTAANSDEEVDELLAAITVLAERSLLRTIKDAGADALKWAADVGRAGAVSRTPRSSA